MENNVDTKLVAVINSVEMNLYKSKGIKVIEQLEALTIVPEKHNHHTQTKTESFYQKKSTPGSLFDPRTDPKDIEYAEAAKRVSEILEDKINNNPEFKRLIIIADPKMLGNIRQFISNNLKKIIYKEIAKNLVGQDITTIEKSIFK